MERGRLLDAQSIADDLKRAAPRNPNVHQLLGMIAGRRHRFGDAITHFQALRDLVPADPMAQCRVGTACMHAGQFADAVDAFAAALELRPGFADAIRGQAELRERDGDAADGLRVLAPLLADPMHAGEPATILLHAQLLAASGDHAGAAEIVAATTTPHAPSLPAPFLRKLHFVRGRSLDKVGSDQVDAAAASWTAANAVGAMPFDPAAYDAQIDAIIETFSAERLARTAAAGPDAPERRSRALSDAPILVVGLPRSGSTLVEQILDAHPAAHGTGESTAMPEVMADLTRATGAAQPFPAWWADASDAQLTGAGAAYVQRLEAFRPDDRAARAGITRLIDKNLLNLSLVGAIAEMLPAARFVICRRDPIDNGFSIWVNDLAPVGFPWSGDLAAIGHVSVAAARLAEHWTRVLPDRVRLLDYETMVDAPEASSRELLEFAGLDWDDRVLKFYETGRAVTTLSYDQVRKPIYRSSVRRSDRYREHLQPMVAVLERGGLLPAGT